MLRFVSRAVVLSILLAQSACTSLGYVTQAAAGQADLNQRARDIDTLVGENRVDARKRRLLSSVALMKKFGERHGLAATTNYRKYVRIDRPAVVWVVSASDPLQFHSRKWTFPLVGSFTYLGWFKLDEAKTFAETLRKEGLDVDVRGSQAYSTEGYFEDAVLSTMIPEGKAALGELANVILHESTHATFFVRHQSTLNESVANFVGDKLADLYMAETLPPDSDETAAYHALEALGEARGKRLREAYLSLQALYASNVSDDEKLATKRDLVAKLGRELRFKRPINNATLIQYKTYNSGDEELATLLKTCGDDWPRFIRTLKQLETSVQATDQVSDIGVLIAPLIAAGCTG